MTDPPAASHEAPDALLEGALDALPDPVFVLGSDGTLRYWNRAFAEAAGSSDGGPAGEASADLLGPDAGQVREAARKLGPDGPERTVVRTVLRPGTDAREFELARIDDPSDGPAVVGIGREAGEPPVDAAETIDRMTDAFLAVDDEWRLTAVNDRAREVLAEAMGRDPTDDLEGLHLWEEIPEAAGTRFHEAYREVMETGEPVTLEARYEPLDTWFEVRAYPAETGLSVYFRDVTDRREREREFESRERLLREIYDAISDTDRSFRTRVETILERTREALGTAYGTLSRIDGDEYVFEIVQSADDRIEAGTSVPLSATYCERTAATERTLVFDDVSADAPGLTDRDGFTELGIDCYLGAPVFAAGDLYGTLCFYDVAPRTEEFSEWEVTLVELMSQWASYELTRRRTRQELERQNDQLEDFASIVSHDLRNPLNVLGGSLELARDTGEADHFDRCARAVERMETLIDDMLALARAGKRITDPEPVALATVAESCWEGVDTAGATLVVEADATIRADESRLRQLLENLLRNSVEHGSTSSRSGADDAVEHGSTSSAAEPHDAAEHAGPGVTVTVGDLPGGFYVADDGPGIPPEERENVFEGGYSTDPDGTGFGLRIVRGIAEAHGWDVRIVESEAGGARFELTGADRVTAG